MPPLLGHVKLTRPDAQPLGARLLLLCPISLAAVSRVIDSPAAEDHCRVQLAALGAAQGDRASVAVVIARGTLDPPLEVKDRVRFRAILVLELGRPRRHRSLLTRRWREMDSNPRSLERGTRLFKIAPFDHSDNSVLVTEIISARPEVGPIWGVRRRGK
jgi:hypothetical protein